MILILLLEVRNLKNIIKLTRTITAIVIVLIMKTITSINVVMIIKLIALQKPSPTSKETAFILGDSMVKKIKWLFTNTKTEP